LRAVNSSEFPHVENPGVPKVTFALSVDSSKAPEIYFFSGWAGVAIKFMDGMAGGFNLK
jgi:hypothetical protein